MAISPEQRDEILEVVVGLFNGSPDGNVLTELSNLVEDGTSIEDLADLLAAHSLFTGTILAGKVTVDQQVDVLMDHFGLVADDDPDSAGSIAQTYFTSQIEAGTGFGEIVFTAVNFLSDLPEEFADTFADAAALLANKVQVASLYAENNPSDSADEMLSVLAGVSSTFPVTEAEAIEYLNSVGQGPNPGQTFDLTFGDDTLTGTAGNDTFNGGLENDGTGTLVQSWEDVDSLDGGAGTDTLNATLDGSAAITPQVDNVEIINIRNVTANATVDFADVSGAEQIWNNGSTSGLTVTYDTAPLAATFGVRNSLSVTDINTFDDVTGTEDNLSLAVAGAGSDTTDAVIQSTTDAASIEAMSIDASGENFVDVSAFTAIAGLTVTGTGSITAVVDTTALETFDASGNSGGVTVDLSAAGADLTITGGSGDDDITAGTANDTIDAGEGNDRVAFGSGLLTTDDTVDGGDGDDTIALTDGDDVAGLTADSVSNFESLELGAAGAAITVDNDDFGFTSVILGADIGFDVELQNLGEAELEIKNSQTGTITVTSAGDSDALNVLINAEEAVDPVVLAGVDVTGIETVTINSAADTDNTEITTIEVDGVTTLTFAGAAEVVVDDITDADDATKLESVDLTGLTGGFELNANSLAYGTTFALGNLGEVVGTAFDFGDGAEEASVLLATAGFRDTIQFTTAFENDVVIDGGEFGGDVTDDRIDLSSFGLAGIDDLTFTDVGADVVIENEDFGGGRILLVGVNGADVNVNDFVF